MINVLERLSPGARVAVIRLRSLGDCVLTTPAISLLKQARPDLRIAMVVEDAFAPVFTGNPDLESILPPRASEISRWRPELTLNLHGGATSVRLTIAGRSRWRAGFAHFRFRPVYNIQIPRAQEILHVDRRVHTAEHVASAMFYLGVPQTEIPSARLFAKPQQSVRPYAVLHPLASAPDKTWPSANFLAVAEHLDKRLSLDPVFIAGPAESIDAFAKYRCLAGAPLEEVKSLVSGASLFVGNDSGPAHMAAAFGLPVVVLFGSSDPDIWRPWRTESSVLTSPAGINSIGTTGVVQAIETLLVPQPTSHFPPPR
jgi:ADP-heptose:LPS heptosyltransferase